MNGGDFMIEIAIVEDEEKEALRLGSFLDRFSKETGAELSHKWWDSASAFLEQYQFQYDLIFMDIRMPGIDGMAAAERLREIDSAVKLIFITSLAQYAVQGYSVDALDYILKPVSYAAFALKMQRAVERCAHRAEQWLLLNTNSGAIQLKEFELCYVEIFDHHIRYHTLQANYDAYGTLKSVEQRLPSRSFFRCNNQCIVNLRYVSKLEGSTVAVECLWAGVWTYQWILAKAPLWEPGGIVICKYLGTYLLTIGAFRLCLRCGWSAALYGGTSGYILQHCAERITEIAQAALGIPPGWGEKLLLAACTALICLCFVLVFRNRYDISEYDRYSNGEGDVMLLTAAAAAGAVIVLEPLIRIELGLTLNERGMIYLNVISVLFSVLAMVVSMCQMRQAESKKKAQIATQLLHTERSRYALEKEAVDAINIRCHDIKHQIAALGDVGRERELREIERLVDIYDCGLKTQCAALDVVLASKSLMCLNKQIELTCMADGRRLAFMEDADIYALFGNILDNAIEAVEQLDDEERRLISLSVHVREHFLHVSEENYYSGDLVMDRGLPMTTKEDKRFHGFGMQSIRMLTEKYGGDLRLRASGGIYRLSILFPIV